MVEKKEKCFDVIDQGLHVEFKKYNCDKCQHIYTEESYGTERHESLGQEEREYTSGNMISDARHLKS